MYAPLVIISAILFFLLTPGILVSLPPGCDTYTTAAFHSIVFAILWMIIQGPVSTLFKQTIPGQIKKTLNPSQNKKTTKRK